MDTLLHLVDYIPPVLLNGLTVAGKMLPAIGFAMILSVMAKKELIPFVLIGYVCAAYLPNSNHWYRYYWYHFRLE
ncbi:PTS system N-acetylgalactosamine-specific transporter subunit IIC [Streptococcus dysgalactiae]|nr:PTS system N-acetylgalactosamine-specific transporter subunit IIC [Streptococcus dysgalactiae]